MLQGTCHKVSAARYMLQIYAARYLPQGVCCKVYAARYLLQEICCNVSAARYMLQGICCKVSEVQGNAARIESSKVRPLTLKLLVGLLFTDPEFSGWVGR